MKKTTNTLLVIIILILALTACANQQPETQEPEPTVVPSNAVVAEGNLKPVQAVNLSFQARGMVESVDVKIGDRVSKGDVLARLANASQAEAQLAAARLELVNAQQALDTLLRTGPANLAAAWDAYMRAQEVRAEAERDWENLNLDDIEDNIEDDKADVEDRAEDLKDAQEEFDKYKDLDEDNSKRKNAEDDLENAQEDYNEAIRKLEEDTRERDAVRAALDAALAAEAEARYQYELSAEGANKDQLELAQARLANAQAQVASAESNLSNYILTAPFDGVVLDVAIHIGEQVGAESRAVSVADTSSWIVETTDITELEVVDVAVGQKVTFTADALSDVTMDGVVAEISQSSFTQGGDVIYTVRIRAEEVDPRIKWGMTVEVTFEPLDS
ncbi:MAG: efflux RND transporter periplasmic adaptor subunit [Chloroflexi bacterium]|nr:efflux RND transporter periplasmic adaptor subunit [Chloroflexota bacterium]